jgi:hypothetical protein
MSLVRRLCGLALGVALSAVALPAVAQPATTCPPSQQHPADAPFSGIAGDMARAPCAEPLLPPATSEPVPSQERVEAPPAGVADVHVASTELGFKKGIAPAPGRTVGYRGSNYLVIEVAAVGDGPTFSGGSQFVITTRGGALEVGLKAMDDRDRQMAAVSHQ